MTDRRDIDFRKIGFRTLYKREESSKGLPPLPAQIHIKCFLINAFDVYHNIPEKNKKPIAQ